MDGTGLYSVHRALPLTHACKHVGSCAAVGDTHTHERTHARACSVLGSLEPVVPRDLLLNLMALSPDGLGTASTLS